MIEIYAGTLIQLWVQVGIKIGVDGESQPTDSTLEYSVRGPFIGSPLVVTPSKESEGTYGYDYTPTIPGDYLAQAVSTGAVKQAAIRKFRVLALPI